MLLEILHSISKHKLLQESVKDNVLLDECITSLVLLSEMEYTVPGVEHECGLQNKRPRSSHLQNPGRAIENGLLSHRSSGRLLDSACK